MTMTKQRKNRVVVEITTNIPITERGATQEVQIILSNIDTQAQPIELRSKKDVYIDNLIAKSFWRVTTALTRKWLNQMPVATARHVKNLN